MTTTSDVKVTRTVLRNVYGWQLVFIAAESGPDWNTVVVEKSYRGAPAGELVLTRDEARAYYRTQTRAGFVRPNAGF